MSGGTIIGELLRRSAAVTRIVDASRIKTGRLPEGAQLPSILVRDVSMVERQSLRRRGWVRVQERVEVVVRAGSNADQKALTKLVRDACAGFTGSIADISNVAVTFAGAGPTMDGANAAFERTQDFRVGFDAQA